MIWCAHCRKHYAAGEFRVQRREGYVLWTGHRVKFVQHRSCGKQTIMLDGAASGARTMAAAQSR